MPNRMVGVLAHHSLMSGRQYDHPSGYYVSSSRHRKRERDSSPHRYHNGDHGSRRIRYDPHERRNEHRHEDRGRYYRHDARDGRDTRRHYEHRRAHPNPQPTTNQPQPVHQPLVSTTTPEPPAFLSMPWIHVRDISVYEKTAQIGEGTYGQVFKGKEKVTGWTTNESIVALKKVRMESEREGFPVTATREIKILTRLDHPNIVKLKEMVTSKNSVYLVFEYLEFDMAGLMHNQSFSLQLSHSFFSIIHPIKVDESTS